MWAFLLFVLGYASTIQLDCMKARQQFCTAQTDHAITACLHMASQKHKLADECVVHLDKHIQCTSQLRQLLLKKCPALVRQHSPGWTRHFQALIDCGVDSSLVPSVCENLVNQTWSKPSLDSETNAGVYVDDLTQVKYKVGYGILGKKGQLGFEALPAVSGGYSYSYALSMHPPPEGVAFADFNITDWKLVCGWAALADSAHPRGDLKFEIIGDSKLLWSSKGMNKPGASEPFRVNITSVRMLRLQTRAVHSNACAHTFFGATSLQQTECPEDPA